MNMVEGNGSDKKMTSSPALATATVSVGTALLAVAVGVLVVVCEKMPVGSVMVGLFFPGPSEPTTFPMDWRASPKQPWASRKNFPEGFDEQVIPYTISVEDEALKNLNERLSAYRSWETSTPMKHDVPSIITESSRGFDPWHWGISTSNLTHLIEYWKNEYDWEKHKAQLNEELFATGIDGIQVVFKHLKPSKSIEAKMPPVLLIHGWPGSIVEFNAFQNLLLKDGHSIVVPCLPGYGFSSAPRRPGYDAVEVAIAFHKLMDRLGYQKFYIQGGDWGAIILEMMVHVDKSRMIGVHTNFPMAFIPPSIGSVIRVALFDDAANNARMRSILDVARIFDVCGYMLLQSTRPETIGSALSDSPGGLLAWITEKFHGWSDVRIPLLEKYEIDDLITNTMMYWLSNSYTSSARYYKENLGAQSTRTPSVLAAAWPTDVPTGVAIFPYDMIPPPERFAIDKYGTTLVDIHNECGHFAAQECPLLLLKSFKKLVQQQASLK